MTRFIEFLCVFVGTIFFSLYYLCLAEPLNKLAVNWVMAVSVISGCPIILARSAVN